MGLPFGPRKRLLAALQQGHGRPVATPEGERRQLTVLFCDMVGFTELTLKVDPELLQSIVRRYEEARAACISRYDGYVYRLLGDGILAFFGFPLAHEGEAARAIRAGLEIVETISNLEIPEVGRLRVRIGIAAGIVVVAPGERNVGGEPGHRASRLEGVGEPGGVVVSDRVYRLAGGEFDYEDLGELDLKGIAASTRAYNVLGVSAAASRFDAVVRETVSPLVGRTHEMEALLERWQAVCDRGAGQAVLLSGEPGFGKSRISSALLERLGAEGVGWLRFQCSPFFVNSAFYPFISSVERMLDFGRDEAPASRLDKLEALIVGHYGLPPSGLAFGPAVRRRHAVASLRGPLRPAHHGAPSGEGRNDPRPGGCREGGGSHRAQSGAVRGCALGRSDHAGNDRPPHRPAGRHSRAGRAHPPARVRAAVVEICLGDDARPWQAGRDAEPGAHFQPDRRQGSAAGGRRNNHRPDTRSHGAYW